MASSRALATCPICLDCADDDTWIALECGHVLHTTCAAQNEESHSRKCPVCRRKCNPKGTRQIYLSIESGDGPGPSTTEGTVSQEVADSLKNKVIELVERCKVLDKENTELQNGKENKRKEARKLECDLDLLQNQHKQLHNQLNHQKAEFKLRRKQLEDEHAAYRSQAMDEQGKAKAEKRGLERELEMLRYKLNRLQASAKVASTDLQHIDDDAKEFVSRFSGSEECLGDALLKTYTEFKKVRDRAAVLEQRCVEEEADHKMKAATATREWRGQLETLQTQHKARGLRINELEAMLMNSRAEQENLDRSKATPGPRIAMPSSEPFSTAKLTPLATVPRNVQSSFHDMPEELGDLPGFSSSFASEHPLPPAPGGSISKAAPGAANVGPSFMGKQAVSSHPAMYGARPTPSGHNREGFDGQGGMTRTLTSHSFLASRQQGKPQMQPATSGRKRTADVLGEQKRIDNFFVKNPHGGK